MEGVLSHGVAIALILLAAYLRLPQMKQFFSKRRIEKGITNLGAGQLRNFMLDDGMEGKVFIERLLLHPDGLLLLAGNWRDGHIFGGERIDNWAQVVGKRTYKFANPFYSLETALAALRYHAPGVRVTAEILFLGNCTFPKGQPEGVLSFDDLNRAAQGQDKKSIDPKLQLTWERLGGMVEEAVPEELALDEVEAGRGRTVAANLLVVLAVGWWTWHLCPF